MYLSPFVKKYLYSMVIKSFVPELRSRKCFFVFRDSYVIYEHFLNIICTFHLFMYGYAIYFKCTSWSFLVHFGVHLYFRMLSKSYERQDYCLSLMISGERIGNLCNCCFVVDFAFLVVRVGVIDPTCIFVWTTILDLSPFLTGC